MFGGLPCFPENDNQVFGDGYRLGGGGAFFQKLIRDWYWKPIWGGVNTGYTESTVGTQWGSILKHNMKVKVILLKWLLETQR